MPRKIPMRQCVGCGESRPKKELIRIVCNKEGEIRVDVTGRMQGRGAYICPRQECLNKAAKRSALNRAFERPVDPTVFEALKEELSKLEAPPEAGR